MVQRMVAGFIIRKVAQVATVLLYMLCIVAAFCGKVNPLIYATPAVLVLVFPYVALLTLIVGVVWLLLRRYVMAGMAAATLLMCWGTLSLVFPMSTPSQPSNPEKTFTLLSYNFTHGTDLREKDTTTNRAMEYILSTNADIVCLEEMRYYPGEINHFVGTPLQAAFEERYPFRVNDYACDCSVFSRFHILHSEVLPCANGCEARLTRLDVRGTTLTVINVHLSPYKLTEDERAVVTDIKNVDTATASVRELKGTILDKLKSSFRNRANDALNLRSIIDEVEGPLIVCGDFNDVPASWVYNTLRGTDMRDAFVDTNFLPRITYNMHCFWFHIDQVLYRGNLQALDVKRDSSIDSSDHYPLLCSFEITTTSK